MALRLLTQLSATTFLSTHGVLVVMFIVKYLHDVLYLYSYSYLDLRYLYLHLYLHPRYSYLYSYLYVLVLATTLGDSDYYNIKLIIN